MQLLQEKKWSEAAAILSLDARFAFTNNPGVFSSRRFDSAIQILGGHLGNLTPIHRRSPNTNILHVLTYAGPVGGDTRFVHRWIQVEARRSHSVAIMRPSSEDDVSVPKQG